jgi:H+/gluconate symporter-like permease
MTSVALSAVLFVISFVVLMFLVMKGVNLIPAAIIGGIILSFAVEGGPINALFTLYSSAAGGYCSNLLIAFMFGGAFSGCMIGTGSDVVLGRALINKFGTRFAIIALAIFVAICGFVGIQSWPFLAAVFAFSLMKAADLPLNVACVTMVGINSAFSFMFPGSPTVGNLIASQALGTTMYDGAFIGVVMCAVQVVLVLLYVNFVLVRKYRRDGTGYTPSPMEAQMRADAANLPEDQMPSFVEAIIPLLVVVAGCPFLQFALKFDSTPATVIAQTVAILVCLLLNIKRGFHKRLAATITNGCIQCAVPLLSVCAIVGYSTLVSNTAFFTKAMDAIGNMNASPYIMVVIGTALFAALSADSMGGISGAVGTVCSKAIAAGANPGLVHRLTLAAATTFDSMPFSSMLNVTMSFLGLSHKDVYRQIVVVQIGATSAATIVGMIIAMIVG